MTAEMRRASVILMMAVALSEHLKIEWDDLSGDEQRVFFKAAGAAFDTLCFELPRDRGGVRPCL